VSADFADRYVTLPDPLAAFDEAYYEMTGLLFASMKHPGTPLGSWSFDRLREHVVQLCDEYAAVAEGVVDEVPDRGNDFVVAFAESARRARHAFYAPDYLHGRRDTPIGLMPGSATVQHVVNELVSHAWDIAHAIGGKVRVPDDIIDRCRLSWQVYFETFGRPGFNFEPEKPAPEDGSAADRLAAYLGRTV
jgi:uncharacterized protein (TIGR03086 family)